MSLPGLNLDVLKVPLQERQTAIHELRPNTEWRFEVAFEQTIEVKLLSGTAEVFGTELAQNQLEPYVFQGTKAAIFTWHGCKIGVTGSCLVDYIAEETPMISYGNTHFALETLRQDASLQKTLGPRILIVGPENAGKTSLVKILAAYAYRSGGTPVVANLDPKEGFLTIPGTISASALESIIDITEGWGSSPINGPSQIPVKLPLVYQYGLEDPDTKSDHFKAIIRRLALSVTSRLEDDETAKSTGCIIDTAGSLSSSGKANYDLIQHIISEFQINVLITLGSERLHNDMSRRFSSPRISILKLDKSGGCVDRDAAYMHHLRNHQIRTYFFGNLRAMLSPHSHQIPFDEILIYRTTTTTSTTTAYPTDSPTSSTSSSITTTTTTTPYDENPLLPSTTTTSSSPTQTLERLPQPSTMMLNAVLAIVQADINDAPDIVREASVIGFVFVSEVDDKRRKIRVLAPMTGRLPRRVLVWSSFPEAVGDLLG